MTDETSSPTPDLDREAIESASALAERFDAMTKQIKRVADRDRRTRRLAIGLAISVFFDFTLSGGFIYNQIQVHSEQVGQCQAGNDARAKDKQLWDFIIGALEVSSGKPLTSAQKRFYAELNAKVNAKDPQKNCAGIYRGLFQHFSAEGKGDAG